MRAQIAVGLQRFTRPIDDLREDPDNARVHDPKSIDVIKRSLQQFGQQKPIVVRQDGTVIAGNGLYRAARQLRWESIAAVEFTGDEDAATAYGIADNRTAELSSWDRARLAEVVRDIGAVDEDLVPALGFMESELRLLARLIEPIQAGEAGGEAGAVAGEGAWTDAGSPGPSTMTMEFETAEEETKWFEFLVSLRKKYPLLMSHGARLTAWAEDLS